MKNILVPVDFSDNSENALEYACFFADKVLATIHILHTFKIDIPITQDVTQNTLRKWEDEEEEKIFRKLDEIVNRIREKTGTDPEIKYIAKRDNLSDRVEKITERGQAELVIMGTKGSGDMANRFFGSNTSDVLNISKVPVLAVPHNAKYRVPKNIIYATEYQYADIEAIKKLTVIATLFDSSITLLHVSKIKNQAEQELYQDKYKQMIEKHFDYDKMTYKVFQSEDVPETLNKYVEQEQGHILSMSTRGKSVWERLFDRSMTKYMTYHTKVPLLVFKNTAKQYED